ncbi:MAG: hypothetical protein ACI4IV_00640 [Acutalibacteraceae bacterium]
MKRILSVLFAVAFMLSGMCLIASAVEDDDNTDPTEATEEQTEPIDPTDETEPTEPTEEKPTETVRMTAATTVRVTRATENRRDDDNDSDSDNSGDNSDDSGDDDIGSVYKTTRSMPSVTQTTAKPKKKIPDYSGAVNGIKWFSLVVMILSAGALIALNVYHYKKNPPARGNGNNRGRAGAARGASSHGASSHGTSSRGSYPRRESSSRNDSRGQSGRRGGRR